MNSFTQPHTHTQTHSNLDAKQTVNEKPAQQIKKTEKIWNELASDFFATFARAKLPNSFQYRRRSTRSHAPTPKLKPRPSERNEKKNEKLVVISNVFQNKKKPSYIDSLFSGLFLLRLGFLTCVMLKAKKRGGIVCFFFEGVVLDRGRVVSCFCAMTSTRGTWV